MRVIVLLTQVDAVGVKAGNEIKNVRETALLSHVSSRRSAPNWSISQQYRKTCEQRESCQQEAAKRQVISHEDSYSHLATVTYGIR